MNKLFCTTNKFDTLNPTEKALINEWLHSSISSIITRTKIRKALKKGVIPDELFKHLPYRGIYSKVPAILNLSDPRPLYSIRTAGYDSPLKSDNAEDARDEALLGMMGWENTESYDVIASAELVYLDSTVVETLEIRLPGKNEEQTDATF